MLLDTLKIQMIEAMKVQDKVRVGALRMLISDIRNLAISKYGSEGETALKDFDVLDVIKKQVKTHKESVEAFSKAGRNDLVAKEKAELAILTPYLPEDLSDDQLREMFKDVVASGENNFGLLMKSAMALVAGRADGGRVSAALKQLL